MKALSSRLRYISFFEKKWQNATSNVAATPDLTFRPNSKKDLIEIIQDAESKGLRVRPVGAGHSFSQVAAPDQKDYFVEMFRLRDCSEYPEKWLNKDLVKTNTGKTERHFVKAQAGIRIKCLNKALDKMGLALINMGAFDWQTVSGALSTGTHGTGINQPAFPDMVRALVMIGKDGVVTQYEPEDGITNEEAFYEEHWPNRPQGKPSIELVQNNDKFYSAVLGLGAMGVIYELVLEVVKPYWIKENRTIVDWETELKPQLLNGYFKKLVEEYYDFVSFRVNPYPVFSKKHRRMVRWCVLTVQKKWDTKPPENSLRARTKNWFGTVGGNVGLFSWWVVRSLNRKISGAPASINTAIRFSSDKLFVGKSYKALYQSGVSIRKHGISSEFSFDVDYNKLVDIIDGACEHLNQLRIEHGLYQTSHIPVRFVQQSKAYLSPCFTGPKMFVDFPTLEDVQGRAEIMQFNQEYIVNQHDGVPHWGKVNDYIYDCPGFIQSHYPKVDIWKTTRRALDPNGTFLSDFIIKMGLK